MDLRNFIPNFYEQVNCTTDAEPWALVQDLESIIKTMIQHVGDEYSIQNNIAIHKDAVIESGVILKGSMIISAGCFIGSHAYLRGPLFLGESVVVGPSSEVKHSIILAHTTFAHMNFVGDSIIGSHCNFEAGSICANHYNERDDKTIFVKHDEELINTQCSKFGALVGDGSKIGANAVLSPGTLLGIRSIVKRLELVEQIKLPSALHRYK